MSSHVLPIILATACLSGMACDTAHLEREWEAFGQPASAEVWAVTEQVANGLLDEFPLSMETVEAAMSADDPESELARINATARDGYVLVENHDLFRAIALGVDYARATDGAYDPTAGPLLRLREQGDSVSPEAHAAALAAVGWRDVLLERGLFRVRFRRDGMRLDLDGLKQGYAIDVAARNFARSGSRAGMIRLGDHRYAWGPPPGVQEWWVELEGPSVMLTHSRAIAMERRDSKHPALDPRTGQAVDSDVEYVVVLADSTADAVAIARGLMVAGSVRAGTILGEKTRRVEAVIHLKGGRGTLASATLADRLRLASDGAESASIRYILPPNELPGSED